MAQGSGSVLSNVAPHLARWRWKNKQAFCFPALLSSYVFIYFVFFPFVYSSIGYCHGEGRCPWRAAQQESIYDGWIPEESGILKQPVPSHLAAHPYHPVAFHTTSSPSWYLLCFFSFSLLPICYPFFFYPPFNPASFPLSSTHLLCVLYYPLEHYKLIHSKDEHVNRLSSQICT